LSALYIVATPIGNLADMTLRAIEILKSVDVIAAEDTRHSQKLLMHFDIHTPCFSLHDHNETERIQKILTLLSEQKSIALISDAGTPLISDPGFRVVRAVREKNYAVISVPGACAAIAALSVSGLATDRFIFEGFLPVKKIALEKYLEAIKNETRTIIFYESVHRIQKTLLSMRNILGDQRKIVVARELTKSFETISQGTLQEIHQRFEAHPEWLKGEFVLVVSGAEPTSTTEEANVKHVLSVLLRELPLKQAVQLTCDITDASANATYDLALILKEKLRARE